MGVRVVKEIDAATMRANLSSLTAETCRRNAVESAINAERLFDEGSDAAALFAQQQATMWATLALSCALPEETAVRTPPDREHACCHNSQRLPAARLLAAGDPEPQVNPGTLYVDPGGAGARYLLRVDGVGDREWLWCDSLAQAESTLDEAVTWEMAMGCGIIRVREATEREQIEFREGTGGAALDLVRRLLGTLATLAKNTGDRTDIAKWLADCEAQAGLSFHTWQWPAPPAAEDPDDHARYGAGVALRRAAGIALEAPAGRPWRQWLLECAAAGIGPEGDPWPAPPSEARAKDYTFVPQWLADGEELKRLTSDTLMRLRDQAQALIVERAQTDARQAEARKPRGGAEQWREG
jgi:hypothetical protein